MSAKDVEITLDVGGSSTLVGVEHENISIVATLPDNTSERDLEDVLDDLDRELKHTQRVVAKNAGLPNGGQR